MKSFATTFLLSIVTAAFAMTSSTAAAWPGQDKYLVKTEAGVQYVLFPEILATGILNTMKSAAPEDQKLAIINSKIFVELAKIDESPTFCTVAGPVYQTPNRDAAQTEARCEELLRKPSFAKMLLQDPPENLATITPLEFSEQLSKYFAVIIQML